MRTAPGQVTDSIVRPMTAAYPVVTTAPPTTRPRCRRAASPGWRGNRWARCSGRRLSRESPAGPWHRAERRCRDPDGTAAMVRTDMA